MSIEYPENNSPVITGAATTPVFDEVTQLRPDTSQSEAAGKADQAKDEAKEFAEDAKDTARDMAGSVKEQTSGVASVAKRQAEVLLDEATGQLREQAGTQKTRAAEQLHSVGEQLTSMADSSDDSGPAVELVRNLGARAGAVASWLGDRDPDHVLADVRAYASRKPGTFIGIAAAAGILAGRLTKSLVTSAKDDSNSSDSLPSAAASSPTVSSSDSHSESWTTASDSADEPDMDLNRRGESL